MTHQLNRCYWKKKDGRLKNLYEIEKKNFNRFSKSYCQRKPGYYNSSINDEGGNINKIRFEVLEDH